MLDTTGKIRQLSKPAKLQTIFYKRLLNIYKQLNVNAGLSNCSNFSCRNYHWNSRTWPRARTSYWKKRETIEIEQGNKWPFWNLNWIKSQNVEYKLICTSVVCGWWTTFRRPGLPTSSGLYLKRKWKYINCYISYQSQI